MCLNQLTYIYDIADNHVKICEKKYNLIYTEVFIVGNCNSGIMESGILVFRKFEKFEQISITQYCHQCEHIHCNMNIFITTSNFFVCFK